MLYFSSSLMKMNHRKVYGPDFPKSVGQMGSVSSLTFEPRGLAPGADGDFSAPQGQAGGRRFLSPEHVHQECPFTGKVRASGFLFSRMLGFRPAAWGKYQFCSLGWCFQSIGLNECKMTTKSASRLWGKKKKDLASSGLAVGVLLAASPA